MLLFKASRPPSWVLAPLVFLLGIKISGGHFSNWLQILQLVLLTMPYCVFLYGINDVFDFKSDMQNPRKGGAEGLKLQKKHHRFVYWSGLFFAGLLALSSIATLNFSNMVGMAILLFFSYYYSAPPLRLKERPPLDSFANGMLYLLGPFILGFSFAQPISSLSSKVFLITICVMGIHSFSTIMDYSVDKKSGDKTFAVVFGKRAAALFPVIAFTFTLLLENFNQISKGYIVFWGYLIFCNCIFFIGFIHPDEKLARKILILSALGFIAAGITLLLLK